MTEVKDYTVVLLVEDEPFMCAVDLVESAGFRWDQTLWPDTATSHLRHIRPV